MRVLVLDSALAHRGAAIVDDDAVVAQSGESVGQRTEATLPEMAREVMRQAATDRIGQTDETDQTGLDLIAVTVGPGSFTGIRSALALAHGIGLGLGVPVVGVTVGEAIAEAFPHLGNRDLWTVTGGRRGHVFLEREGAVVSLAADALPKPPRAVAVAGDAALQAASRLAAGGANVMLTDARVPLPARRHAGTIGSRDAQPLYVDPPEARPPEGGLRPAPEADGR
jgi:tRNA threonylcarbamoyladenosine biosynthesis protein TsaB